MIYFLLFLIVMLLFVIGCLFANNYKIKATHNNTINQLHELIFSLHQKQQLLNDKVLISNEYGTTYAKDMKVLGDEVVELQKVFIDIISNKNYK
jgi:outer membrane lipoprotein-sorting protein